MQQGRAFYLCCLARGMISVDRQYCLEFAI